MISSFFFHTQKEQTNRTKTKQNKIEYLLKIEIESMLVVECQVVFVIRR